MPKAWSISTTVRNPDRLRDFMRVASNLNGQPWNANNQCKFQILLIQARLYGFGNTQFYGGLTEEQIDIIDNLDRDITYEEAEQIFVSKNYESPAMRGRQSLNPLKKMGFVYIDSGNILRVTDLGFEYINPEKDEGDILFKSFLKLQYPNPISNDFKATEGFNIKPFIGALQLIKKVNEKWEQLGHEGVGLSKYEFSLFVHTLVNYGDIDSYADKIIDLRNQLIGRGRDEQKNIKDDYMHNYIQTFFMINDDEKIDNQAKDLLTYGDNTLRYFRMTRFICLRGNGHYIDLEPRRSIEIQRLLETFDGSSDNFENEQDYIEYLSDINQPPLPWENVDELHRIIRNLINDINDNRELLLNDEIWDNYQEQNIEHYSVVQLNQYIEQLRLFRRRIQERLKYKSAQSIDNLDSTIDSLSSIFNLDNRALQLEKFTTYSLESLNDSLGIRPNYPVGDDGEPTNTAPGGVADIECFYEQYNAICEVTLLKDRSQWYNEGQPIMRHLRNFENQHRDKPSYCLFIAPNIHQDTLNTFWNSVKYEYEGASQRIVPMTINQFILILGVLRVMKERNAEFRHGYMKDLFDSILNLENVNNSLEWIDSIQGKLNSWKDRVLA